MERLSDDQQAEYLRAFGPGTDLGLVKKYAHVRLTSLLRSMILHVDQVDFGLVERECRGLARIQARSAGDYCSQVADVARFLGELDPEERQCRCEILRELDGKSRDGCVVSLTLDLSSGSIESNNSDSTFMARPHPDYLDAVQLPLDRLRLAQRTGSAKTKQEEAKERAVWNREMTLVNKLHESESV